MLSSCAYYTFVPIILKLCYFFSTQTKYLIFYHTAHALNQGTITFSHSEGFEAIAYYSHWPKNFAYYSSIVPLCYSMPIYYSQII